LSIALPIVSIYLDNFKAVIILAIDDVASKEVIVY